MTAKAALENVEGLCPSGSGLADFQNQQEGLLVATAHGNTAFELERLEKWYDKHLVYNSEVSADCVRE